MLQLFETAVSRIVDTVKPLLFKTGIEDAPYGQAGTIFLVGRRGRARGITCRHLIWPEDLNPICLYPGNGKRAFLPIISVSFAPSSLLPDDYADLAIVEVDIDEATRSRQGFAKLLNLDLQLPRWEETAQTTGFVVLGYPRDRSYIDYEDCRIHSEVVALYGSYDGPMSSANVHTMRVSSNKGLNSFSGFSGGPVFSLLRRVGHLPVLQFCGMAIQGSAQSGLIHFIDSETVLTAVDGW
jgi:hypothetical protein